MFLAFATGDGTLPACVQPAYLVRAQKGTLKKEGEIYFRFLAAPANEAVTTAQVRSSESRTREPLW